MSYHSSIRASQLLSKRHSVFDVPFTFSFICQFNQQTRTTHPSTGRYWHRREFCNIPLVESMVYAPQKLTDSCVIRLTSQTQQAESPDRLPGGAGIWSAFCGQIGAGLGQLAHTCTSVAQFALFPKGSTCDFVSPISVIQEYRYPWLGAYRQTKEVSIPLNKEKEPRYQGRGSLEKEKVPPPSLRQEVSSTYSCLCCYKL